LETLHKVLRNLGRKSVEKSVLGCPVVDNEAALADDLFGFLLDFCLGDIILENDDELISRHGAYVSGEVVPLVDVAGCWAGCGGFEEKAI